MTWFAAIVNWNCLRKRQIFRYNLQLNWNTQIVSTHSNWIASIVCTHCNSLYNFPHNLTLKDHWVYLISSLYSRSNFEVIVQIQPTITYTFRILCSLMCLLHFVLAMGASNQTYRILSAVVEFTTIGMPMTYTNTHTRTLKLIANSDKPFEIILFKFDHLKLFGFH